MWNDTTNETVVFANNVICLILKMILMKTFRDIIIAIETRELTLNQKTCILEFLCTKIDINTISGMARKENKTPRGIKISNRYRKINIGDALLCIKGLKDNKIPF